MYSHTAIWSPLPQCLQQVTHIKLIGDNEHSLCVKGPFAVAETPLGMLIKWKPTSKVTP